MCNVWKESLTLDKKIEDFDERIDKPDAIGDIICTRQIRANEGVSISLI